MAQDIPIDLRARAAKLAAAHRDERASCSLQRAVPIAEGAAKDFPGVDALYLLQLVDKQVAVALAWPTPWEKQLRSAWGRFRDALLELEAIAFDFPSEAKARQVLAAARREVQRAGGSLCFSEARLAAEIARQKSSFDCLRKAAADISRVLGLPALDAVDAHRAKGGRPTSFNSDAIAEALRLHFVDRTGSPRWSLISQLLSCAPEIPGVSMRAERIKQRLNRWRREDRASVKTTLSLAQAAYELARWISGPTPLPATWKRRLDAQRRRAESLEQAERHWAQGKKKHR